MSHYYNVQGNYISSLITLTQGGPLIFRWKMQSRLAFLLLRSPARSTAYIKQHPQTSSCIDTEETQHQKTAVECFFYPPVPSPQVFHN